MKTNIQTYIKNYLNCSDSDLKGIDDYFDKKTFPKKTILLREGEVCKLEGFILSGCVKSYLIDKNGFEVVLTFATENWWACDIVSFQEQKPSRMYIETIEDTEMLILTPKTKEEVLEKYPKLERMFRLIVQRHLQTYQERLFGNIALTAEERYDIFLKKYPGLSQRIPQHQIASYLGISAEFLSRIRGRKLKA